MSVLIFANGDLPAGAWVEPYLAEAKVIIAADGGARHILAAGYLPHIVIGDFDSLNTAHLALFQQNGVISEQHPAHKDETDLELALQLAAQRYGDHEILILGMLGGRLDQMLGNILLLAQPAWRDKQIQLVEPYQRAWVVHKQIEVRGQRGDTLSLIPIGGDVHIGHTTNLQWALNDEWLTFGSPRGISNTLTAASATVQLKRGQLLCIHTDQAWRR